MYLSLLIAFSSLSDINTTLKIGVTITWSFMLHYVTATTSLWCWKNISYNDVTSISIRNQSISRCKSNKKPMSLQYGMPTGLWQTNDFLFSSPGQFACPMPIECCRVNKISEVLLIFQTRAVCLVEKEKTITFTNFQLNQQNNEKLTVNSKRYCEH